VFHEKLGTQHERVERIARLARELAPHVKADPAKAERAAWLCKADLVTEMVGEFPELQGTMGRYYAEAQGEDEAVAHAIEDHYKPQGPTDLIPADPVSVAVALAEKIYSLVGFWWIDEKPTGSKDPYALRRAALGVIRLILENNIRLPLFLTLRNESIRFWQQGAGDDADLVDGVIDFPADLQTDDPGPFGTSVERAVLRDAINSAQSLLAFFADRLKVQLREQGARHDLVDAVFALAGQDDLLLIVRRVESLARFLNTDDGKNLLAGYKRAVNIIRIEERKDGRTYTEAPYPRLFQREEWALANGINVAKIDASAAVGREDFAAAMAAIAKLRPLVDTFFDKVTVNAEDAELRANRLRLLNEIREATLAVADFSKIEG